MKTTLIWIALTGLAFAKGPAGVEEAHGFPGKELAFHAVNFAILAGIIWYFARDKVRHALANRAVLIKKDIDTVNAERKEALDRFSELEAKLDGFERQLSSMKEDAEEEGRREHDVIIEKAQKTAELVVQTTARTIRDETLRARQALHADAVELSVKLAEEQLKREVTSQDQDRFAHEFLSSVDNGNGADHG